MVREDARCRVASLVAGTVLAIVLAFHGALAELEHRWTTQEEYSHGFLIPFVSAWLLWTRKDTLRASVGPPSWLGPILVIFAFALHAIGELSAVFILSQVAFVIVLVGIMLSVGGHRLLAAAFVPIAFLLFAIPLPYFVDAELTLRLQLLSSQLGAFLIRLFGIPVYLDGNIIDLGNYQLQVVEACSGLRYLYPLLSVSFLAAYIFEAPRWQRILLFLSAIPIAIAMNGFRIGLVGILVDRWGTAMAEGALHFFEGWIIFLACGALLLLEMYLMSLRSQRRLWDIVRFPDTSEIRRSHIAIRPTRSLPLVTCLVLLCLGGATLASVSGRADAAQTRLPFAEFPSRIGSWQGRPALLDVETERGLGLSDYLLSDYSRADGNAVNIYVAYYASQRKGESPHSPIVCIPGGGWTITNIQRQNLGDGDRSFNRVVIKKRDATQLVYYWFDERGRTLASEIWAKFYLFADAILTNRTDGALVRLTTPIGPSESERDADMRLQAFMHDAVPQLSTFLPTTSTAAAKSATTSAFEKQVTTQ